jgi:hypothetical protein
MSLNTKAEAQAPVLEQPSITPSDLTQLQIAQSIRDYHHKALWEEEKHFSWFLSIIFSLNVILITSEKLTPGSKGRLILFVSVVGVLICLIALRVVRNESANFQHALHRFNSQYNHCFVEPKQPEVSAANPNKTYIRLVLAALSGRASIRDAFQLLFLVFFVVFAVIAFTALGTLL